MTLQKIIEYPEPLLRFKAREVANFDETLSVLIEDMAETMFDAPGIGLAAPQVAQSLRLIVVDTTQPGEDKQYMALVNPEIIGHEGEQIDEEGCLSVPELTANVKRFKKITVR
ncbi:MAG: peptide deformylase, partial [Desulfobacterales bacterium]|nr:peptide deformylase [Desulfobacterales bacterium]